MATINGKTCKLEGGNCKHRNVIYLFQCTICSICYVGKTDQPLHKRVNGHRNCGELDGLEVITDFQALQYHASVTHKADFDRIYKVSIIKNVNCPNNLLHWEQVYVDKFNTQVPFGLNIENPLGIRVTRLSTR